MTDGVRIGGGTPPAGGGDDLKGSDQALLSALVSRGRDAAVLSPAQEKLLDDWMADRLAPADASRAAALTKNNILAAERILEHRLLAAAKQEPTVSAALTARILKAANQQNGRIFHLRWPAFGSWRWSGLVGAIAASTIVAVIGLQQWRGQIQPAASIQRDASVQPKAPIQPEASIQRDASVQPKAPIQPEAPIEPKAPIQLALATISDRGVLFEPSDVRMRGVQPPGSVMFSQIHEAQQPGVVVPAEERGTRGAQQSTNIAAQTSTRFRDFEVPTSVLRRFLAAVTSPAQGAVATEILPFLGHPRETNGAPLRILVDAVLSEKVAAAKEREQFTVRLYNLMDPRVSDVRRTLEPLPSDRSIYFVTFKP